MQLCIFEDLYYDRLEPLIYARPVYDLVCGMNMIREKIARHYPGLKLRFHTRPYLEAFLKIRYPEIKVNELAEEDCLFINGRILPSDDFADLIPVNGPKDTIYMCGSTIAAARVSASFLPRIVSRLNDLLTPSDFEGLKSEQVNVQFINYTWDLINNNHNEMLKDFKEFIRTHLAESTDNIRGTVFDGAHLVGKENIYIAEGAVVKPGVVLDASGGPIVIDRNAVIYPNSVIEGPVYIGESSQIKSCARIYENVSIGRVCKVGGELEHSIIHSFSNKQHSGFLGHAYLGSWVNIGADTNCSDLKNNYGNVKVYVNGEIIDSGSQFLGLVMGDHSKAAINSMFNTGSVVGFSCNVFGSGFPPKYLPSFSWGGSDAITTYDIERSLETAKRVMLRRQKVMSPTEENLFRKIFDITQKERRKRGYPY